MRKVRVVCVLVSRSATPSPGGGGLAMFIVREDRVPRSLLFSADQWIICKQIVLVHLGHNPLCMLRAHGMS